MYGYFEFMFLFLIDELDDVVNELPYIEGVSNLHYKYHILRFWSGLKIGLTYLCLGDVCLNVSLGLSVECIDFFLRSDD